MSYEGQKPALDRRRAIDKRAFPAKAFFLALAWLCLAVPLVNLAIPVLADETPESPGDQLIEIKVGESQRLQFTGLENYLINDPDMVQVERPSSDVLALTAVRPGDTILLVWDDQGRHQIRVKARFWFVLPDVFTKAGKGGYRSFGGYYAFNSFIGQNQPIITHNIAFGGTTPFANVDLRTGLYTAQNFTDLSSLTLGFSRSGDYLAVGDVPSGVERNVSLQGVSYTSNLWNVQYNLIFGKSGNPYWGKRSTDNPVEQSTYYGVSAKYTFWQNLTLNGIYSVKKNADGNFPIASLGLEGKQKFGPVEVSGNATKGAQGYQWGVQGGYDVTSSVNVGAGYNYTNPDFVIFRGNATQGSKIINLSANWRPYNFLKFTTAYNRSYFSSVDTMEWLPYPDSSKNFSSYFSLEGWPSAGFSYWEGVANSPSRPYIYKGINFSVQQRFKLFGLTVYPNYGYGEYYKEYPDEGISSRTYSDRYGLTLGIGYNPWPWLKMNTGYRWSKNNQAVTQTADAEIRPLDNVRTNAYLNGEKQFGGVGDSLLLISGLRLTYEPWKYLKFGLNGSDSYIQRSGSNSVNYYSIYLNGQYNFDTGFYLYPSGRAEGYVFLDANNDGVRTLEEKVFPDQEISLKDKTVKTDKNGFYKTPDVPEGSELLGLNESKIPAGYHCWQANPVPAAISSKEAFKYDWPIGYDTEVSGVVYEDLNNDGQYTPQIDRPMVRAGLHLGDRAVMADVNGRYNFTNLAPGNYVFTIDIGTLPIKYQPLVPLEKVFDITETASFTYDIPVGILGTVGGRISWGEGKKIGHGCSGVGVFLDDKKMYTNNKGEFLFKNVTAEAHVLKIDVKTLPAGQIIKQPSAQMLIVTRDQTIIRGLDYTLVKGSIKDIPKPALSKDALAFDIDPMQAERGSELELKIKLPKDLTVNKAGVSLGNGDVVELQRLDDLGKFQVWGARYLAAKGKADDLFKAKAYVKASGFSVPVANALWEIKEAKGPVHPKYERPKGGQSRELPKQVIRLKGR